MHTQGILAGMALLSVCVALLNGCAGVDGTTAAGEVCVDQLLTGVLVGSPNVASGPSGRVVYSRLVAGGTARYAAIWVTDGYGKGRKCVTHNYTQHTEPAWSPDGRKIAYWGCDAAGDGMGMEVRNADGSNPQALGQPRYDTFDRDDEIAWSPDGRKIAFSARIALAAHHIYVMQSDGSHIVQLTRGKRDDRCPTWSPDSRRIAFYREAGLWEPGPDWRRRIYLVAVTGGTARPLPTKARFSYDPDWSPDGRTIAFACSEDGKTPQNIWLMNADGSGRRAITHRAFPGVCQPNWSPDGRYLVCTDGQSDFFWGPYGLWRIRADGTAWTKLDPKGFHPEWGPTRRG